jgi:DNA-binding NarL/FixJ family response regulator
MTNQPTVLILLSDDTQEDVVCETLRGSSRAPSIVRAAMLSEALRILNNNHIDAFICDHRYLSHQTSQTFRIILSKYSAAHLLFVSADSGAEVPTGLQGHERVSVISDLDKVLETLHGWDICRERRARPREERRFPEAARAAEPAAETEISELKRLTPRQNEILMALSRGLSNKEIARELGIQETTVKVQLKLIYRVLQVSNRTQAAVMIANRQKPVDRRSPMPTPAATNWQPDGLQNLNVFFPSGAWPVLQYGTLPTK